MVVALSVVRFTILPITAWITLSLFSSLNLLPPGDRIYIMSLMIMSVMPPAQNAVILLNIEPQNRRLVPVVAKLIAGTYALATIPITLVVTLVSSGII